MSEQAAPFTDVLGLDPKDQFGHPVEGVDVVASKHSGPAAATLFGPLTATTNASGVATFSALAFSGDVGVMELKFAVSTVGVISDPFTITPGPVASTSSLGTVDATLQVAGPPPTWTANTTTVNATLRDVYTNLIFDATDAVLEVSGTAVKSAFTNNADGTYTWTLSNPVAEITTLTLAGTTVSTTVTWTPGYLYGNNCTATISPALGPGENMSTLILRDSFNNLLSNRTEEFGVRVYVSNAGAEETYVFDWFGGTKSVTTPHGTITRCHVTVPTDDNGEAVFRATLPTTFSDQEDGISLQFYRTTVPTDAGQFNYDPAHSPNFWYVAP